MRVLVSDRKVPSSLDVIVCVVISELDGIGTEDGQLEPKPAHFWCFHCVKLWQKRTLSLCEAIDPYILHIL